MLVGQPLGYPLQDHVLVVNVGAVKTAAGVDRPTLIFFGGWDQHDRTKDPRHGEGYLTFMCPDGRKQAEGPSLDLRDRI